MDTLGDLGLMLGAVVLVFIYSVFVLGGCSPVHFRALSAIIGIGCVFLSIMAGYAIAFGCGQKISQLHNILPFMIIGIGVDDMFVIVNSIDQTSPHLSANERFKIGMVHAGPSITITSVTDGIAFLLGSFTIIPALNSFCTFAGISVVTLYISMLTIFSPWFLNDM